MQYNRSCRTEETGKKRPPEYYREYYEGNRERYFGYVGEYRSRNEKKPRNVAIGKALRRARKRRGLTQRELAKRLGAAEMTVHYWETAQIPVNVERIAAAWPEMAEEIRREE